MDIKCPEFFQCSGSKECLLWSKVCDGTEDCLLGDDEIECGESSSLGGDFVDEKSAGSCPVRPFASVRKSVGLNRASNSRFQTDCKLNCVNIELLDIVRATFLLIRADYMM